MGGGDPLSIEYCVRPWELWELREAVPVVDIGSWALLCAPSPLLPSCFWHYSDPEPGAVCCGSHLHTCHEKAAVVRHNIISAAEREGKACRRGLQPLLFTLPKSSTWGHRHNGQTFFFFFHNDKDMQKLPPAPCEFVTGRDVKHNREKSYRQAGVLKENFIPWDEYVTGGVHCPQLYPGQPRR